LLLTNHQRYSLKLIIHTVVSDHMRNEAKHESSLGSLIVILAGEFSDVNVPEMEYVVVDALNEYKYEFQSYQPEC
jgi:hypothetical protein